MFNIHDIGRQIKLQIYKKKSEYEPCSVLDYHHEHTELDFKSAKLLVQKENIFKYTMYTVYMVKHAIKSGQMILAYQIFALTPKC